MPLNPLYRAILLSSCALSSTLALANEKAMDEVVIIADELFKDTTVVTPTFQVGQADLKVTNITTSEDALAYAPNLIVRRRYIGDPNGTIGIRGANQFQTTRTMVFADGLPLHYFLQTSFSGSPRWSLVGPNEIESVDVRYGPFSAEYSGNAMGGVVNIKTRRPTERKFTVETAFFSQDYDQLETDETYNGNKLFFSYEDRFDNLSVYLSYNRLDNESQPQTQFASPLVSSDAATASSGASFGRDANGGDVIYYGDSGTEEALTELYKIKLGYDIGAVQLRGIVAYEDRERSATDPNNFLRDADGNAIFGGTASVNGQAFSVNGSNFESREQDRRSLLLGVGVSAPVGNSDWLFDVYATDFDILEDEEVRSARSPADPTFVAQNQSFRGRLTEYDDTGWQTLDVKFGTESWLGNPDMRLSVGYHFDRYELEINPVNINSITGEQGSDRAASGGETGTQAVFAQWGLRINPQWDLSLGLRYEDWEGKDGFFGTVQNRDRDESGTSPKLSLAYFASEDLSLRYSVGRAIRFPVTEELYQNVNSATTLSIANADLEPEVGLHHNLSLDKVFANNSSLQLNLFYEEVEDTIFNQNGTINGVNIRTFLPVDEVTTRGLELVYANGSLFETGLNLRFNASYTKAEITKNDVNPDIEGNDFPRQPRWRANLLLSYDLSNSVNVGGGIRYASDNFGNLDNSDKEDEVFGGHDEYTFVNLKANWQFNEQLGFSTGVDNLFNEEVFVFHPWPSRTFYVSGKYEF